MSTETPEACQHVAMAAGDARDGGPVFCRKCQRPMRYRSAVSTEPAGESA